MAIQNKQKQKWLFTKVTSVKPALDEKNLQKPTPIVPVVKQE